ncbi:UNVERIFIED_CONTAM: Cgrrf1 [Trichonephila clavipes]
MTFNNLQNSCRFIFGISFRFFCNSVNNRCCEDVCQIALATVVHLPDEGFPLSPQIIGQHVKTSNGGVCTVKKVYLSSPESSRIGGENIDLCLACYHRAITAVIIPCGHACVCTTCLEFCKNCPVCRGPSHSYFELQTIP